ncbi:receptor-like protein EIX2 [Vigna angularis]|uniref:receptor-like protein EIX2 n=1 Tax=Phaseolus angularis TaxID=3914 RepID=UPI0022B2F724|nr:receptor-like protein EIX2 [Vigna angularis]
MEPPPDLNVHKKGHVCRLTKSLYGLKQASRYIKSKPSEGLFFAADSPMHLKAFRDSDCATCPNTRRSTTGFCIFLCSSLISWKSKNQSTVSRSSTKAEYRALAAIVCEIQWIYYLLQDLQVQEVGTPALYYDNKSARHIAHNQSFHERTKHIELDCHVVREKIQANLLRVLPVCSDEQAAYGQHHIRCIPKERDALLQFKAAIVDDFGMLSSWTTPDCCQWEGIRCTNLTAHIISIHLPGQYHYPYLSLSGIYKVSRRYISGEIHKSLMELRHLQYLNLSLNDFTDTNIPEFLGSLTNLRYLDLSSCNFGGQIPSQISSLSHLKYLNVARNYYLEGLIPRELGNLSRLQYLDLSRNFFEGCIPSQLGNLSNLHKLYLGGYDSALKIVSSDQWLSNLNSLTHLSFNSISNFYSSPSYLRTIAKLPKLRELSLSECGLSDHFLLSFNPCNFNFSTSLSVLDLSGNSFTQPMIFQWLSNTTSNLVELDLNGNLLKGSTSNHFGLAMNSLEHLDLSYNVFKGEDLKSFMNICTLRSLYMFENNMTEDLSSILHNLSSGCVRYSLQQLCLRNNQIRGSVPDLSAFSNLKKLDLSYNLLSGKIPEGTRLPSHLEQLLIVSNSLEGGVPKSFGSTCTLELLHLSFNKLSEDLTVIFNHLSGCSRYSLREIYLGQNKVNGTLPDFSIFAKLETLDLSINQISGTLPNTLKLLPSLKRLHLDNNMLNGTISEDLRFPSELEELSLMSNSLKGTVPKWFWTKFRLSNWRSFDISSNNLQGTIPNLPIENHYYSLLLNLASNQFEGPVPSFL